jgi:hypothetical protein
VKISLDFNPSFDVILISRDNSAHELFPNPFCVHLPVLGNVEAPLELQVRLLVVVDEAGDGVVVATSEHA